MVKIATEANLFSTPTDANPSVAYQSAKKLQNALIIRRRQHFHNLFQPQFYGRRATRFLSSCKFVFTVFLLQHSITIFPAFYFPPIGIQNTINMFRKFCR